MAKKLTIGLVLDTSLDPPDGVQQYVMSIGEWLRREGHEVHYLVGQTEHRKLPNIHSMSRNISVIFNGNRTTIPLYARRKRIREVLNKYNFDVLHVQTPHHPLMAQRIILRADKRTAVIGTFHIAAYNKLVTAGNWLLGWWLRPSLKRFDEIISVSPAAAAFAKQTFRITTPVLPNVIDYQLFHDARPLPKYDDDVLTILFLGRLVPRKGCQLLLDAVLKLTRMNDLPKFRVVICGKGPQAEELKRFIKKHQLDAVVEMTGFVSESDKPRYYASSDISVFPSSSGESFGIVLLEAMASGRAAVLAGDNPGYRSVLAPRPELLFDPYDSENLAELLASYLKNDTSRDKVRHWGEDYTRQFDEAIVGRELLDIYEAALHKRATP